MTRRHAVLSIALLIAGAAAPTYLFWREPASHRLHRAYDRLTLDSFPNQEWYGYGVGHRAQGVVEWEGVRSPTSPQWKVRRGFDVERVATGFTYPVNLVFAGRTDGDPEAPAFYVNELHGRVLYVTRSGAVHEYARDLTNFPPITSHPRSDETGLSGLMRLDGSEDLLVTGSYLDATSGLLKNRVLYLASEPGGKRTREVRVLLDLDEATSPSNQIQEIRRGSDGKLYLAVGDAENPQLSLDLDRFGGKVLRLDPDGAAPADNPFFDPERPRAPRSYVWAFGLRNIFGFDVDPLGGGLFAADNGKDLDRVVHLVSGQGYAWNGDPESIRANALYTWGPIGNTAPVGVSFLARDTLGRGSAGRLYVATYGPSAALGRNQAKSILELTISRPAGLIERVPEHLVQYAGSMRTTVLGLAEGPDGLYFTDFFGETREVYAEGSGSVWRVFPSPATLKLPALEEEGQARALPAERGRALFLRHCSPCHRIAGSGGAEGPELTHAAANLGVRLNSRAYEVALSERMASAETFAMAQRPRLAGVLAAQGDERVAVWLRNHLEEPRFDNARAKMPSFAALTAQERGDLVEFIKTRK